MQLANKLQNNFIMDMFESSFHKRIQKHLISSKVYLNMGYFLIYM